MQNPQNYFGASSSTSAAALQSTLDSTTSNMATNDAIGGSSTSMDSVSPSQSSLSTSLAAAPATSYMTYFYYALGASVLGYLGWLFYTSTSSDERSALYGRAKKVAGEQYSKAKQKASEAAGAVSARLAQNPRRKRRSRRKRNRS